MFKYVQQKQQNNVIDRANQWTGFYMIGTSVIKKLMG